jgi:hypothetical protein
VLSRTGELLKLTSKLYHTLDECSFSLDDRHATKQTENQYAASLRGSLTGYGTHLVAQIEQLVEVHAPEGKLLEGALLAHLHHLLRAQCFVRHDAAAAAATNRSPVRQ